MILALFFTRGVSLKIWHETGLFYREKQLYESHLKNGDLKKIYWLTYGRNDFEISQQLKAKGVLHPSIEIISMPRMFRTRTGKLIYSFLLPIIQRTYLKRADVYKTNQMDGSWSAILSKLLYGKFLIVRTGYTLSSFGKNLKNSKLRIWIYQLIEWFAYKFADRAVVASKKDYNYVIDNYKLSADKLTILPNYVDTDSFKPLQRDRYEKRIVCVGRLNRQKNLFNLISALAKTEFSLDVFGQGELRDALEKHAINAGSMVRFKGCVPNSELPMVLNRYKYYIIPSFFEGMPKTLLEAMACGCICIGSNVDGINEVIRRDFNGYLSNGTDDEEIYQALNTAIKDDNELIVKNAVETITKRFSLKAITQLDKTVLFG